MKPPFLLLLATLTFWGWQSGLLWVGITLGVILESARFIPLRWDFSRDDFRRLWNLCTMLTLAVAAYIFASDSQNGGLNGILHSPAAGRQVTFTTVHTATTLLRWLPMTVFLFVAAQDFSERGSVPVSAIGMFILRWRRGTQPSPEAWRVNVSYPYFMVCIFSAGIHTNEGSHTFFWGQCLLIAWAIWPLRSPRFNLLAWACSFLLVMGLAYFTTRGIGRLAENLQNYNGSWLARFFRPGADPTQSITSIGEIGDLKLSSAIVIRLQPLDDSPPPSYLREASYRNFHSQNETDYRNPHSQTWYAGNSQNDFADLVAETNNGASYRLVAGQTNHAATVEIACYLNGRSKGETRFPAGVLPLPSGACRLTNLPAASVVAIQKNEMGAVLLTGPGFIDFAAQYAPGPTLDSPPNTNWDWSVPTNELPALQQITNELAVSSADEAHKLLAVRQFFAGNFTYRTWQTQDKTASTNETPLAHFLLHTHAGHCEYFATATVLLLRELNIPARYAVGYYVHEAARHGFVVREHDAHAWCLVWNAATGAWEDFDTTPGSWVKADTGGASLLQSLSDFFSWLHFQISEFRWGKENVRQYILWALVPIILFLLYQIIFRRRRSRRRERAGGSDRRRMIWPGADSEFYRLEAQLAARGFPRRPDEPMTDWLERLLAAPAWRPPADPVWEILRLHYRHRFDPRGLAEPERRRLAQTVDAVLKALAEK
jgi:hypothetical protein